MGGLWGCVHRTGERWALSAVCLGTVAEGAPGPSSRSELQLGLVRPIMGVIRHESWYFLMVSSTLLREHGKGKQYIQVQNNNTSWKTEQTCGSDSGWESGVLGSVFDFATDFLCYFQPVT